MLDDRGGYPRREEGVGSHAGHHVNRDQGDGRVTLMFYCTAEVTHPQQVDFLALGGVPMPLHHEFDSQRRSIFILAVEGAARDRTIEVFRRGLGSVVGFSIYELLTVEPTGAASTPGI